MKEILLILTLFLNQSLHSQSNKVQDLNDIIEFIQMITHNPDGIIQYTSLLNTKFIENNANITITTKIDYFDDNNIDKIKYSESFEEYNSDNKISSSQITGFPNKFRYYFGNEILTMRSNYHYNNDKKVSEVKFESTSGNKSRIEYLYNEKEIIETHHVLHNEVWEHQRMNKKELDSLGRIISIIDYSFNQSSNNWDIREEKKYKYSENTETEIFTEKIFTETFLTDYAEKRIRIRNNKNKLKQLLFYKWKNNDWRLTEELYNIYDLNGSINQINFFYWGEDKLDTRISTTYKYNDQNQIKEIKRVDEDYRYENNDSPQKEVFAQTFYYNGNGFLKKIEEEYNQLLFYYDSSGFLEEFVWKTKENDNTFKGILSISQNYINN